MLIKCNKRGKRKETSLNQEYPYEGGHGLGVRDKDYAFFNSNHLLLSINEKREVLVYN